MRIGIDIRALQEGRTTGVQVYIVNLLNALFQLDSVNQYALFANSFSPLPQSLPTGGGGKGEGVFDYPNVRLCHFRYPNKLFNLTQKIFGYPKIDRLLEGLDLFFSPHFRITALSRSTPLVITFHDLSFEIMPEFFTARQQLWHKFMDYSGAARGAQALIAVSESTKNDLVDLYKVPEEKIRVIYPGNPVIATPHLMRGKQSHGHGIASSPPKADPRNDKNDYFLYFGTFEPRKNLQSVLAAYRGYLSKSKNPKGLILAGSSGWKTRLPRSRALGRGLPTNVKILQNVSEKEKVNLYQNAFAFLFPSFYEGFGFPVLEAASHGLPVIAAHHTSLAEMGSDFYLFVNPFRPSQIAEVMLELENDSLLYKELSDKGIAAAKRFSWEKTAEETLKLFNTVITSPQPSPISERERRVRLGT